MDERTLLAVSAALEATWLESATVKEIELLQLSGERPDLFKKTEEEAGEIRVVLGFALENGERELVMGTPNATVDANAAELVFRRTRIRSRLGLPSEDCGARRPNPACTCLTAALDALGDEIPDKSEILAAARKLHVPARRRWRRPAPKPSPSVERQPPPVEAEPAPTPTPLPSLTETPTKPIRARWRRAPDPLSFAAFKRGDEGPSTRGIFERQF